VLTGGLQPKESELTRFLGKHGDGVRDIAFEVEDADACFHQAVANGAEPAREPWTESDANGSVRMASIRTYGSVLHTFVDKSQYAGPFLPGYRAERVEGVDMRFRIVDHIVGNVEDGRMNQWVEWYEKVLGFNRFLSFDDKDISTEYTALRSTVMAAPNNVIKFPLNEPAPGLKTSQIEEFVHFHGGAGSQHVALLTDDILHTVTRLRAAGVEFLEVPDTYYDTVVDRVGPIDEDLEAIKKLRILVDRDDKGYLLQLFTKPVEDRPTLFFEIIQRKGSLSFGKGNFKALFESIEREQELRHTL